MTTTLKLTGLIVSRFELIDPGPMGFSPCVFIPLMISFMHITLAIGSRLSCLVWGMGFLIKTSWCLREASVACPSTLISVAATCWVVVVCTSRAGRDSTFFSNNCSCFSASNRWDMRVECFVKFMLRYCWDTTSVAGGNVDRVFSISSASVISWPQSRNRATMRCSSELKKTKSRKSWTRKLIQSVCAWGRNRVCWWLNLSLSCAQRSAGSFTSKYCIQSAWSRCRRRSTTACHLHTTSMFYVGLGPVEVDATGLTNVLAKSPALRTVFASLIHSSKIRAIRVQWWKQ